MHLEFKKFEKLVEFLLKERRNELGDGSGDSFVFLAKNVYSATELNRDSLIKILEVMKKNKVNIGNSSNYESVIDEFKEINGKIEIHNCTIDKLKAYYKKMSQGEEEDFYTLKNTDKIDIFIDKIHGIYSNKETKKPNYGLKTTTKKFKVLESLCESVGMNSREIAGLISQKENNLLKAITSTNELFKKKLELEYDLIIKTSTGLIMLNKEKYNIFFL